MLRLLKSKVGLLGQGFVVAIAMVLLLGRYLRWSMVIQLGAVMVILVVAVIVLIVGFVRANKSASAIQSSMKEQGDLQKQGIRPDNQAEIEQMQSDLEDAIERLKASKLGGGRSGKAALYALPWYMIVGPPAAGKTTAIANSGLNFPIGMDAYRGVGGTRNCDWFFADSAIFLDTAGRYMTEQEDVDEWNSFLQTLKENRKKQPINGVMIAISISELADASPDQIEWHASTIRRRIDDLVTRLGVTFPVYLILTKCDLLNGFTEFFGALSRRERNQILGATLPTDWESRFDLRELFESEFDGISSALVNWRNEGLGLSMKREDRHQVYVFPLEFASVKANLTQFVSLLFQSNPYKDTPAFRGFYFTSGTQEGLPIDRVINAIAGRFGFEPTPSQKSAESYESKAYFIQDVFEKVIIPDRYLVTQSSKSAGRNKVFKSGVGVVSILVLVLFLVGSSQAFFRSSARLGEVQEIAENLAAVNADATTISEEDLSSLSDARVLIAGLETPPKFGWGLDRGDDVREPSRKILLAKVREYMNASIFPALKIRISAALSNPGIGETGRDVLEEDTKAYLLLTSHSVLLDSSNSAGSLKRHLELLADELPNGGDPRVHELLGSYVDGVRDGVIDSFEPDSRLVERAVQSLRVPINATRLYNKLKRDSELLLGEANLDELVGAKARYFESNGRISKFFTQVEWAATVEPRISEYSVAPVRDAWVPWALDAPTVDPVEFEEELTTLYLIDYKNEWDRFLRSVRVRGFRDLRDAAEGLGDLADVDDSPLLWLLSRISHETSFPADALAAAADAAGQSREPRNVVETHFRALHLLDPASAQSGEASPLLIQALGALRAVSDDLESLEGDPISAADYAARVLQEQGGDLEDARRDVQSALTSQSSSIRENLFERPIVLAWGTLLGSVQSYLDESWKEDVYDVYRERLDGKYPLADGEDAPIRDFEEYFRPNGDISLFAEERLAPFVQGDNMQPRRWQSQGINISGATRSAIERIKTLQQTLFSGDNLRWDFTLTADLPEKPLATRALSYYLNMHGTTQLYEMTQPVELAISWPRNAGVTLRVSLADAELPPKQYEGDWAAFRFFEDAEVIRASSTEYDLKWDMGRNVKAVYHASVQSSLNPFNDRDLFKIVVPSSLGN